jgi:hypothetical protein
MPKWFKLNLLKPLDLEIAAFAMVSLKMSAAPKRLSAPGANPALSHHLATPSLTPRSSHQRSSFATILEQIQSEHNLVIF